ncbi:unnamed protein product [Euphydryas editha]|uniref:Uncharacterized protein n=1 Tax=Euphydryas editha TaxID=104508 RepID=A0AAU9THJ5_EUPED|nr:unnamed protein product [Euphydryas editha]
MDPRRFYGGIHTIIKDYPDDSTDEDLSDAELRRNRGRHLPPLLIPESDESDSEPEDNILLSQLASSSTMASRAVGPRWRDGFLERAESELQFTGDVALPADVRALETPFQIFKYFLPMIFLNIFMKKPTNMLPKKDLKGLVIFL